MDEYRLLSRNFKLKEFFYSDIAERSPGLKREQYNPPFNVIENLEYLVRTALQPLRDALGYPIQITSGYRARSLNELVGGSTRSQHCAGEAADCTLSDNFLSDPHSVEVRDHISGEFKRITGLSPEGKVNANFFLWAFCSLNLERFDIDQVIHEYGDDYGRPAWVHISASRRQNRRQIVLIGEYTGRKYLRKPKVDALKLIAERAGVESKSESAPR